MVDFYVLDQVASATKLSQLRFDQNLLLDKELGNYSWTQENWQELVGAKDYLLINLVQNDGLIGLLLAKLNYQEAMVHLLKLVVTPEKRKQGFGIMLLGELAGFMESRRLTKLFLEVEADNIPAISLYEKAGVNKIYLSKNFYSNGKSAWKMLKENAG